MKGDTARLPHRHSFVPEPGNTLVQCTGKGCGLFLAEAVAQVDLTELERLEIVDRIRSTSAEPAR